jgi:hypothetical protein
MRNKQRRRTHLHATSIVNVLIPLRRRSNRKLGLVVPSGPTAQIGRVISSPYSIPMPVLIYSRKIHLSPCYTEVAFAPLSLGRLYIMLAYFVGSEILFGPKYWITLPGAN